MGKIDTILEGEVGRGQELEDGVERSADETDEADEAQSRTGHPLGWFTRQVACKR